MPESNKQYIQGPATSGLHLWGAQAIKLIEINKTILKCYKCCEGNK